METLWDQYEADNELKGFYLKHRIAESVECITLAELLRKHAISSVDLLQIDTEGAEFEIITSIDFDSVPVRFVNYESVLLNDRQAELAQYMRRFGYTLLEHDQDTFCFKSSDRSLFSRNAS
jgi:hypothetical protein